MLGELHIKNIGIIDEITINFDDGLNILTGETGAGKSLIIDSISAISGSRMSKDIIKRGENSALVEACFFISEDSALKQNLESKFEFVLPDENIILTREFYQNGRNVCKINGSMVTLAIFKEVGEALIDIHGQHDNQSLMNEKTHIELLDNFALKDIAKIKNEYKNVLEEYKENKKEIEKSFGDPVERARRLDLLKYQNEEIVNSNLKIGEDEELEQRRAFIMNAEKIFSALSSSYDALDNSIIENLGNCIHNMNNISSFDKRYENIESVLNDAYYSLKDVSSEISSAISDAEFNENEQNEIEERLDLIFSLKRKYGNDIESILKYNEDIEKEINFLENSEDIVNKLKEKQNSLEIKLKELAIKIRDVRKKAADVIAKRINKELQDLEMKKAFIEFEFKESESFLENGMDIVQILISTNVGEGLKPLSKIASGGEISRVMLAIKTVLCDVDSVPTMIFDEIDTGISGQVGKAVAEKMKFIGKTHQVICVTHLPTIAAFGDVNFFIEKIVEKERTKTKVTRLDEDGTVKEIARILAGNDITKAVLEHARELRKIS